MLVFNIVNAKDVAVSCFPFSSVKPLKVWVYVRLTKPHQNSFFSFNIQLSYLIMYEEFHYTFFITSDMRN